MRGKARARAPCALALRITPAHAGKRCVCLRHFAPREDHPRPCGEKRRRPARDGSMPGSPPPMRGKGAQTHCACQSNRITPAHAGKSHSKARVGGKHWDHPRPCGEKLMQLVRPDANRGSPPPMRGKDGNDLTDTKIVGITPAHAGKRPSPARAAAAA